MRRRITRLKSDHHVYQEDVDSGAKSPNDKPPLELINRNPRNLEQLLREPKPYGWELEFPSRAFWNKVTFEKVGKYLEAKVVHHTGRVVLSASTKEEAYKNQGLSLADQDAAINLGKILARRCLEAGILYLHKEVLDENTSEKAKAFVRELISEGIKLKEPEAIQFRRRRDI